MTRKSLQGWYDSNDISYSEKERLNKILTYEHVPYYLIDLQQILRCENWAKNSSEIRNKLNGRIKKIIFFTPNFNDSKPDASNYSCAIVTDGSNDDWVIVYRPSYVANIEDDVIIKKVSDSYEVERKLNGDYPATAITKRFNDLLPVPRSGDDSYLKFKTLPYNVRNNPDKYLLPLDIVQRDIHFAVYLGNEWVAHLPGGGKPTKFDTWNKFCNPESSSSGSSRSFSSSSFSSSSSGSNSSSERMVLYHPKVPFKKKYVIIRHIAKTVSYEYGRHSYNAITNNCEHLVKRWIFGVNSSTQTSSFNILFRGVMDGNFSLTEQIENENRSFDDLTSSYYDEKERVEDYISQAENNRNYTRSRYQIEEEKFEERIIVYPKEWCRIS